MKNQRVPFDVWYLIFEKLISHRANDFLNWMRVNKMFYRVLMSWQQNTINKLQEILANMKRLLTKAIDNKDVTVSFDGKISHYVKNVPQTEFHDVAVLKLRDSFCSYCYRITHCLPVVKCGMVHYCSDCMQQNLNGILMFRTSHRSYRAKMIELVG